MTLVPRLCGEALDLLGHEAADRGVDQPVQLGRPDLVRGRGHLGVDERRGLDAQPDGLPGHHPGLPGRQVTADHPLPQPGQPVAQLQGLPEVALPGLGAHRDADRELRDAELRDPRRTRTGQGEIGVAEPPQPPGLGVLDGLRRMHQRPSDRRLQQLGLGPRPQPAGSPSPQPAPRQRCPAAPCPPATALIAHTCMRPEATDTHPDEPDRGMPGNGSGTGRVQGPCADGRVCQRWRGWPRRGCRCWWPGAPTRAPRPLRGSHPAQAEATGPTASTARRPTPSRPRSPAWCRCRPGPPGSPHRRPPGRARPTSTPGRRTRR